MVSIAIKKRRRIPLWKSALLACVAAAAYFAAAYHLKMTYDPRDIVPETTAPKTLLRRPFSSLSGSKFAVAVPDQWYGEDADSVEDGALSNIAIYEDGAPLGPAHTTQQDDIATIGRGRFLHWNNGVSSYFIFSSSDNSDPRTNGRSYWAVRVNPPVPPTPPTGKIVVRIRRPFETFAGSYMAVAHDLDALEEFADDQNNRRRSQVLLYEGDRALGPAHSIHNYISLIGEGRYSHWKTQGMVFSASDNSDPNTNGRPYWAVLPEEPGR